MSRQEANVKPRFDGHVAAAYPLALLESIRAHDRPGEVLEDEDLSISLPRRLGLTGVIETQIFRYESARKAGRAVPLDDVMGLIRLVMRRPDAEPILRETGQRMARWHFRRAPRLWTRVLHRAPASLGLRSARIASTRALRALRMGDNITTAKPFVIRVAGNEAARLEEDGIVCTLITGLVEEQLLLSTGKPRRVRHTCCLARGDELCEWSLIEA
jgi:predicted hydrocarbon binding protein